MIKVGLFEENFILYRKMFFRWLLGDRYHFGKLLLQCLYEIQTTVSLESWMQWFKLILLTFNVWCFIYNFSENLFYFVKLCFDDFVLIPQTNKRHLWWLNWLIDLYNSDIPSNFHWYLFWIIKMMRNPLTTTTITIK